MLVQNQLCEFLKGKWSVAELNAAFNDTKVKKVVQKHFRDENIRLVDQETGEPIFKRATTLIGQHGEEAVNSPELVDEVNAEPEQAKIVS